MEKREAPWGLRPGKDRAARIDAWRGDIARHAAVLSLIDLALSESREVGGLSGPVEAAVMRYVEAAGMPRDAALLHLLDLGMKKLARDAAKAAEVPVVVEAPKERTAIQKVLDGVTMQIGPGKVRLASEIEAGKQEANARFQIAKAPPKKGRT